MSGTTLITSSQPSSSEILITPSGAPSATEAKLLDEKKELSGGAVILSESVNTSQAPEEKILSNELKDLIEINKSLMNVVKARALETKLEGIRKEVEFDSDFEVFKNYLPPLQEELKKKLEFEIDKGVFLACKEISALFSKMPVSGKSIVMLHQDFIPWKLLRNLQYSIFFIEEQISKIPKETENKLVDITLDYILDNSQGFEEFNVSGSLEFEKALKKFERFLALESLIRNFYEDKTVYTRPFEGTFKRAKLVMSSMVSSDFFNLKDDLGKLIFAQREKIKHIETLRKKERDLIFFLKQEEGLSPLLPFLKKKEYKGLMEKLSALVQDHKHEFDQTEATGHFKKLLEVKGEKKELLAELERRAKSQGKSDLKEVFVAYHTSLKTKVSELKKEIISVKKSFYTKGQIDGRDENSLRERYPYLFLIHVKANKDVIKKNIIKLIDKAKGISLLGLTGGKLFMNILAEIGEHLKDFIAIKEFEPWITCRTLIYHIQDSKMMRENFDKICSNQGFLESVREDFDALKSCDLDQKPSISFSKVSQLKSLLSYEESLKDKLELIKNNIILIEDAKNNPDVIKLQVRDIGQIVRIFPKNEDIDYSSYTQRISSMSKAVSVFSSKKLLFSIKEEEFDLFKKENTKMSVVLEIFSECQVLRGRLAHGYNILDKEVLEIGVKLVSIKDDLLEVISVLSLVIAKGK